MKDLAVVILTYNEEMHIGRALKNIADIAGEVFVIDSFSKDRTVDIAKSFGATVLEHPFKNYAQQFQWALDNAPISKKWVMRLDADEIVEADLALEINEKLPILSTDVVGINLKRKHIFMDRWVRHGGRYPLILLRIWRQGHGRIEDRWMDEHMVVSEGKVVTFQGGFSDHNINNLNFFTDKHNKYATREAIDVLNQKYDFFPRDESLNAGGASFQASIKRLIKENIYNHLPFTFSALSYFLWRYIFQLGFLDGRSGLIYHFLQGYWYRFLVGAKIMELEQAISNIDEKEAKAAEISRLTGHQICVILSNKT